MSQLLNIILCIFYCFASVAIATDATCDVNEGYSKTVGGGVCNDVKGQGEAKCKEYCSKLHGGELLSATCSDVRANNKRECICKLKCVTGSCIGDPHCYSFDGVEIGYQGLQEHYLIKPINKYAHLPNFEVRQINTKFKDLAVYEKVILVVPEWNKRVEIAVPQTEKGRYFVTVDGNPINQFPFRFSEVKQDFMENFISINSVDPVRVVLETSFGLRISVLVQWWGYTFWADVSVSIPRHSDLKDNCHGLLGRWNDRPDDDTVDSKGVKQTVDLFSWAFGDSWLLNAAASTPEADKANAVKNHNENFGKCKKDGKRSNRIKGLCQKLQNPQIVQCAKKNGMQVIKPEDCFTDVCYSNNEQDEKTLVCGLLNKYVDTCQLKGIQRCN